MTNQNLNAPQADDHRGQIAVELPQACTITVDVPANTESGVYTLLSASSIDWDSRHLGGGMNVTLAFTQAAERKYKGQLVLSGNALYIVLRRIKGMTISVR